MKLYLVVAIVASVALSTVSGQCFSDDDNLPQSAPDADRKFPEGSTDFALALFKSVLPSNSGPDDNIFISPASVWSALTLTYLGTRAETKAQLEKSLGLSTTNQKRVTELYQGFKDSLLHSATKESNYTFNTVDRAYFDQKFRLRDCIADNLAADVQRLDFKTSPQPSRVAINKWVEQQTNNKITDLLPPDYVTDQTVMVLVNAAYFKGYWKTQFDEDATLKQQDFFVQPDRKVPVDMMVLSKKSFPFAKGLPLGYSAIEMPYSGNEVSMIVVLPDEGTKAEELLQKLDRSALAALKDAFQLTPVKLSLPKFKLTHEMELKENLKALGITDLFSMDVADLSGFTGDRDSYVEYVRHKTFIEVNEGGTEAAAATAVVGLTRLAAIIPPVIEEEFTVNRPFIILMCHKKTDTILFAGLIRHPKK